MGWLQDTKNKPPPHHNNNLGILAFETAKAMSRLLSLYKSLSDHEVSNLRNHTIVSRGVAFLNSKDQDFLLTLACSERLEDLDLAASVVARLGKKCNDYGLNRFDLVYQEMKLGIVGFKKLAYGSRRVERKVNKMERLVNVTSCLHTALEGLAEMEASERRVKQYRQMQLQNANVELFYLKLENQRKEVRRFRESSLWSKTFDKSVSLMARIVCVVYARIKHVFRPYFPMIKSVYREQIVPNSGPILTKSKPIMIRFYSQRNEGYDPFGLEKERVSKNNGVFHSAGPRTLGGSGLALRYANVVLLAEKYLDPSATVDRAERESLYQMQPENLKALVRAKLSKNMRCAEKEDELLAEGWREAMMEIMGWLVPMADDTVKWQMERNFEKMKFDPKPTVLLLQTLHFADREKTEAAIAEVLVGLSCIYRFENRR